MDKREKNSVYILGGILIAMIFFIVFIVVSYNFKNYFNEEDKKDREFIKVENYVKNHEIDVRADSGKIIENIILPKDFNYNKSGSDIGEILKEKNEFSKKLGYDFEDDLGKSVDIVYYELEDDKNYLVAFLDGKSIVGLWIDKKENSNIGTEKLLNEIKIMST